MVPWAWRFVSCLMPTRVNKPNTSLQHLLFRCHWTARQVKRRTLMIDDRDTPSTRCKSTKKEGRTHLTCWRGRCRLVRGAGTGALEPIDTQPRPCKRRIRWQGQPTVQGPSSRLVIPQGGHAARTKSLITHWGIVLFYPRLAGCADLTSVPRHCQGRACLSFLKFQSPPRRAECDEKTGWRLLSCCEWLGVGQSLDVTTRLKVALHVWADGRRSAREKKRKRWVGEGGLDLDRTIDLPIKTRDDG